MRSWLLLGLVALLFAGPAVVLLGYAVGPGWRYPDLIPDVLDSRSLAFIWSQRLLLGGLLLASAGYSLATAGLCFLLCLAPAALLARQQFRGKALVEGLLLAPALAPAMTFSMGAQTLFIHAGLDDSTAGVVLILTTFSYPYMLRALVAGYETMGTNYGLCAAILGAGPLQRFIRVELPLLLPAAAAGGTVVFLVAFSEYFLVLLIGGGVTPSYTAHLFPYLASSDRSLAAALTLLFLVVPLGMMGLVELVAVRGCRRKGLW
ncbi:ABC transporter permease subunit [Megalodesulfovibrio gigas]|uniref:Putative ABC-type transporter, integral membrane subunit n=1 Tax=Megalodesulfovibrio gigas (strain ATCC 19364 / DSM 1382 / NCIMB 9332 / VKM B-1759) TaxID=1121448 RepID=T2GE90_MEGG1|nr:ABC transporter permease subunit [Megalodesulfovibrio gigas]AGW14222.1 putative ABC-type transporter, integral membrane subunit [Megalodesulfovibrio gigas DSM 1382 = ATCC 19364]